MLARFSFGYCICCPSRTYLRTFPVICNRVSRILSTTLVDHDPNGCYSYVSSNTYTSERAVHKGRQHKRVSRSKRTSGCLISAGRNMCSCKWSDRLMDLVRLLGRYLVSPVNGTCLFSISLLRVFMDGKVFNFPKCPSGDLHTFGCPVQSCIHTDYECHPPCASLSAFYRWQQAVCNADSRCLSCRHMCL
jgi:hypothetical protein